MKERIQKILGNAGVASRRHVEEMIRDGRVAVNGKIVTDLPVMIDPQEDGVEIDGEPIKLKAPKTAHRLYFIMNKPRGVISTNVAQGEQTRAIDLLPPNLPRVYPVGRLDAESKGLLLLTNDGELTNLLTHPRFGVPKTYRAIVQGYVKPEEVQQLAKGVWLADGDTGRGVKARASHIRIVHRSRDKSLLEITLREGRNRQIRRMLARLGHKVRELTRVKFGSLTLKDLNPGQFRALTPRELRDLKTFAERRTKTKLQRHASAKLS